MLLMGNQGVGKTIDIWNDESKMNEFLYKEISEKLNTSMQADAGENINYIRYLLSRNITTENFIKEKKLNI